MCAAFLEKMGQFNREKAPERVVHARGMVAKGHFEVGSVGLLSSYTLRSVTPVGFHLAFSVPAPTGFVG